MSETHAPRFHVPDLAARLDSEHPGQLELPPDQAHHASNVLRLRAGSELVLFDGSGHRLDVRILTIDRRRVVVQVQTVHVSPPPAAPDLHLCFAVPKAKRLDWLLEKATELGVRSLRPVVFARSVAGGDELTPAKRERWMAHCVAAAKQCRLDYLPELRQPQPLAELLGGSAGGPVILGDGDPHVPALAHVMPSGARQITLLVGPEGGLTAQELAAAGAAGAIRARLGHTVLRIETAAIALLAACRALAERPDS